jgi:CBS domain-containing protein
MEYKKYGRVCQGNFDAKFSGVGGGIQWWLSATIRDKINGKERRGHMIKAKDIMTRDVITVYPDTEIVQAAKLMLDSHLSGLPVVDREGHLKGIICQSDLMAQQKKIPLPSFFVLLDSTISFSSQKNIDAEVRKMAAIKVSEAMTPDPKTVDPETSLEDIATLMVKHNLHTLPVFDQGKLVGIIGKEDILRTLMPTQKKELA